MNRTLGRGEAKGPSAIMIPSGESGLESEQTGHVEVNGAHTPRGLRRRAELIEAAAEILHESGPSGVSMRTVAKRVGASLSATTYYFESADELLEEAGRINIARWAERAERVAEEVEVKAPPRGLDAAVSLVLRATLPESSPLLGHYAQLIAAGGSVPVTRAYNTGRGRLNLAVSRLLNAVGLRTPAELVIGIVDGAAVTALSEGRDVHETARRYLEQLFTHYGDESTDEQKSSGPLPAPTSGRTAAQDGGTAATHEGTPKQGDGNAPRGVFERDTGT